MSTQPSQILKGIEEHAKKSSSFFVTFKHKFWGSLFLGTLAGYGLCIWKISQVIKNSELSALLLSAVFLGVIMVFVYFMGKIIPCISEVLKTEQEIKEVKEKLVLKLNENPEVGRLLDSALQNIQDNKLVRSWYNELFVFMDKLKDTEKNIEPAKTNEQLNHKLNGLVQGRVCSRSPEENALEEDIKISVEPRKVHAWKI